ncbi:MAG: lytic transglycosylase domain-containing protein [Candidatus Margulisiibacteriota bacterium]
MDATTGIIILLFVVTIFSSFGGNQGYTRPSAPPPKFSQPALPVSKSNIDPTYLAVVGENARSSIQNYICRFRKPGEAVAITDSIMRHSQKYNVNPKLVAALIRRESGFNPRAISSAGAMGLGQLMPSTAKSIGVTNPYDIDQNAKGTVRYMKYLLGRFEKYSDQVSFALAGYLEGPNGVARRNGYRSSTAAYIKSIIKIYHKI